jgi:eukaryotic-like serine/threonine-protein kinase
MVPEQSQKLAELVREALRQPPAAVEAWLTNACETSEQLADAQTVTRAVTYLCGALADQDNSAASADTLPAHAINPERPRGRHVLGHYELLQWIGAGGMGEVYRARDLALGRDAALKLLPRQFTPQLRTLLVREAAACSRLQHPAIATFYEAGDAGGETFIAMEYVEGLTLRSRCQQGQLPLDEALAITTALLEGLAHAHAAGILHCDVKPENVITPPARSAKLLDFGIARHMLAPALERGSRAGTPQANASGQLEGTIAYMAPEQLLGDVLDARTDVFQVGVVLYEMLTGRRAFAGNSLLERLASVLSLSPDLDALSRADVPADLVKIVSRAVARDRADRYGSAAAFLRDLHDLAQGRLVSAVSRSLAVMDFHNVSGDETLDWIARSTAERLRAELARLPAITVVSRERVARETARLQTADTATAPADAGLLLGCGWVVSGVVDRTDAGWQILMHLTESATSRVVITDRAGSALDQLATTQQMLARAVANAVGVTPLEPGSAPVTAMEAEESFARARLLLDQLGKGSVEQALDLLERAVSIDPEHAPALASLAWAYGFRSIATTDAADLERAITYAERAINVDSGNSEAHMWRGYVLLRRGAYAESARACRRAAELAAANATAPYFAGSALLFGGESGDALPYLQRSLELDGNVGMGWLALGAAHLAQQHLQEAHYSFRRACDLEGAAVRFPTAGAAAYVGEVLRRLGDVNDARDYALRGLEAAERSDHAYRDFFRAHALVVLGRTALDQADLPAALAAFRQVLGQAEGRPQTRSCGQLVVQTLAGLARAAGRPEFIGEGRRLFDAGGTYNFEPFFGALHEDTLFELGAAAHETGHLDEARALLARARGAGCRRTIE